MKTVHVEKIAQTRSIDNAVYAEIQKTLQTHFLSPPIGPPPVNLPAVLVCGVTSGSGLRSAPLSGLEITNSVLFYVPQRTLLKARSVVFATRTLFLVTTEGE